MSQYAYGNSVSAGSLASAGSLMGAAGMQEKQPAGQLDGIEGQLNASLAVIHDLRGRTRSLTDRLLGPQPEGESDGKAAPTPCSVVHRLDTTAAYIRESLSDLSAVLSRLERL